MTPDCQALALGDIMRGDEGADAIHQSVQAVDGGDAGTGTQRRWIWLKGISALFSYPSYESPRPVCL